MITFKEASLVVGYINRKACRARNVKYVKDVYLAFHDWEKDRIIPLDPFEYCYLSENAVQIATRDGIHPFALRIFTVREGELNGLFLYSYEWADPKKEVSK